MEKTLDMADITLAAYELYQDPQNESLKAKYNEYNSKIVILSYLPMRQKQSAIIQIVTALEENDKRPDEISAQLERLFLLQAVAYYTNINVDSDLPRIFGEEMYDALETVGFVDELEKSCGRDLIKLKSMLDTAINWRNIFSLVDGFGTLDMSHIDELTKEVREAKESLSPENIQALKDLVAFNKPSASNFSDMVGATLAATIDKISEDDLAKWNQKQDIVVNLDSVLGEQTLHHIIDDVQEYFTEQSKLTDIGEVQPKEIQDVYDYLKAKNQEEINKIDAVISEENKKSIEQGMTAEIIKLISKKKALDRKYKRQEELLKLADAILSINGDAYNDIKTALEQCKDKNIQAEQQESGESQQ